MIFSNKFTTELRQATAGFIGSDDFERITELFEQEASRYYFVPSCEVNLQRILFALYDKVSFLLDCLKYPHYISTIVAAAFNSNYLTDVIVRNPEYLYWIVSSEVYTKPLGEKGYKKLVRETIEKFRTFPVRVNYLRLLKGRELLRIGIRDILGYSTLTETTGELSHLANAINSEMFELCLNETFEKYGIKRPSSKRYCLVSLGKLGGCELNYSSDADFILFFDENRTHGSGSKIAGIKKEYYELLSEAAKLFTQTSGAMTPRGYIYRVDFRLRPDGRNSPLCRTLKDYLRYYETRGEDWERQMLIKAGFTGGSRKLFDQFYGYLQHYVYPSSFLNSPLSQIAYMKTNIEKRLGTEENVKLFAGGIRDIEFSVQALQLLNGGRLPSVRSGNTLYAIDALNKEELLSDDEAIVFREAYTLYRRIEHYMQLMNDIQTHVIPEDKATNERLARYLGFTDAAKFRKKLSSYRSQVRRIFISIVGEPKAEKVPINEVVQFQDVKRALDNYRYLETGQGLFEQKNFDKKTADAFRAIEPGLVDFLKVSFNPDAVLENFSKIIKAYPFPSIWFSELSDHRLLLAVLTICQSAQKSVDLMMTNRSLGDLLLTRRALEGIETDENLHISAALFILSVRYTLGLIDQQSLSGSLSGFLKARVAQIAQRISFKDNYFIIGLGSFGSREMTFTSDVDLVIIAENVNDHPDIQSVFQKFVNEVQSELRPFEIDFRLRPEGRNSQLVWDIESYCEYIDKRAMNWEFQSLTRLQMVSGSEELFGRFIQRVTKRLARIDNAALKADMTDMRKKIERQVSSSPQSNFAGFFNIKKGRGGLIEAEFIAQYLMIRHSELYPVLIGTDTPGILRHAEKCFSEYGGFEQLIDCYDFFKRLELKLQILFNSSQPLMPLDTKKRTLISREMGFNDSASFEDALNSRIKLCRAYFDKIIA